ncbi:DEAD/DEAH box helicase [Lutimonas zeaxanthinifaciens]|uniref:DEAD/DEAH box helicase n=1 Tax=Lutimonas zeaxanthinifaciens TaxID=3060215 RepID=UPI00265CD20D|nr:DEAD/DEAH box helicase [Lutimonas sp. YSD2104]WKK66563.1 DEAD/DEAH box helicase [Lutimonas sp. YSD2104]
MTFKELGLIPQILRTLEEQGYKRPTPIQQQAIPTLLKERDLLGCAQTGTGKTAAFAIPILQHLSQPHHEPSGRRRIKALIITPTRELATQIGESFTVYGKYTKLKNTVIFGGVKQRAQVDALRRGVDILVATPGRLLDLIGQKKISLRDIEYFVLDEADQMLDMGFIHDIKKIIALLPKQRQSLFFSATMQPKIVALSKQILGNPERVTIEPEQTTAEKVDQSLYYVSKGNKIKLLKHLLQEHEMDSVLVFSRTKHGANKIVKLLLRDGFECAAIHGNKSQKAREIALDNFKKGKISILVATDIAARGIDIDELSYVVNYDLPNVPESYVHRIGRTGRAGLSGMAISFCDALERPYLKDIEKLIEKKVTIIHEHPFLNEDLENESKKPDRNHGHKRKAKPRSSSRKKKSGGKNNYWRKRKTGGHKKSS